MFYQEYCKLKGQYPASIVFLRIGDFYETFGEDARIASEICGLNLSQLKSAKDVTLAGMPHFAADKYFAKLIEAGYKIAVAEPQSRPEQLEFAQITDET